MHPAHRIRPVYPDLPASAHPSRAAIDSQRPLWETKTSRSSRGWRQLGPLIVSRNGGIGRRAWFRSTFSQGSGGSSPLFGTKLYDRREFRFFAINFMIHDPPAWIF